MPGKVLLVSMPFGELEMPALGPCLLKPALARRGIACDLRYLSLEFYARYFPPGEAGLIYHRQLMTGSALYFMGEWLFAAHLFPEVAGRPPLPELDAHPGSKHHHRREEFRRAIDFAVALRRNVAPFLDDCMQLVPWDDYPIVGFSSSFNQNLAAMALAAEVKRRHPRIVTIFGGPNAEGSMGGAMLRAFPQLDYACRGEGDLVLPELAEAILSGRPVPKIPGLLRRGDAANAPRPERVRDLDALPHPDFTDFCGQSEALGLRALFPLILPLEASRGCWWGEVQHCTFCALNGEGMVYRSKRADRVIEELEHLSQRFSARTFIFTDNILDTRYFRDLLPALADRRLDLDLFFETKAPISAARVKMLRDAGVRRIQPGIESLSTHVLELMRKGTTSLRNIECLRNCRTHGVAATWSHLFGFPRETLSDYQQVVDLLPSLHHIQPPNSLNPIVVERFSPFFETPELLGMRNLRPDSAYLTIYPFGPELMSDLAYFFETDHEAGRDPAIDDLIRTSLSEGIRRWQERRAAGADLVAHPAGDRIIVVDTREPDGVAWVLGAFEAAVLRAFDAPSTLAAAARAVAACPAASATAERVLRELLGGLVPPSPDELAAEALLDALGDQGLRIESLDAGWPPEQVSLGAAIAQASRILQQLRLLYGERDLFLALPIFPAELQADTQADMQADTQADAHEPIAPLVEIRLRAPPQAPRR